MLQAGCLRNRLIIQRKDPEKGQNSVGEESMVWLDDTVWWGAIYPTRGSEYHFSREQTAVVTHRIIGRYFNLANGDKPVPGNFRIKYEDPKSNTTRYFDPQFFMSIQERNYILTIMCVESV